MNDVFREVTNEGYFSKIKNAIVGVGMGLLFVVLAFPLQWWNEGRAIKQTRSLEEGASAVISVGIDRVDPANEGKLVHLSGLVTAPGELADPEFGLSVKALGLRRTVEMYQWREKKESKERKKIGGGTETVTEYRYVKDWDNDVIDSSRFRDPSGHDNPGSMPISSTRSVASVARLGEYSLDGDIVSQLTDWSGYAAPADAQTSVPGFRPSNGGFYLGANPSSPDIGDVRVRFSYVPEGQYSFVGAQRGSGMTSYETHAGNSILLIESGTKTAEAMFDTAKRNNTILTWLLRGGGFVLMWIGFGMVFRPLAVIFDVIPLLGNVAAKGVGFVAGILAFGLSLITISMAWIWFRPVLGISLLVLAVGGFFMLRRRGQSTPAMAGGAMPPPPPPSAPPPPPR